METNKIIRGTFILIIAVTLILGWLGFWILNKIGHEFDMYLFIPLYFLIFGTCYIFSLKRAVKEKSPKKIVTSFVGIRMTKLFVSILILILYGFFINDHFKEFIITFLAYYLVYLIIELGVFFIVRSDEQEN